jgi:hypothetical protein
MTWFFIVYLIKAIPVCTVKALVEYTRASRASTLSEYLSLLYSEAAFLKGISISHQAGTDLFLRYDSCKAALGYNATVLSSNKRHSTIVSSRTIGTSFISHVDLLPTFLPLNSQLFNKKSLKEQVLWLVVAKNSVVWPLHVVFLLFKMDLLSWFILIPAWF